MVRVLVCGGRDFADCGALFRSLDALRAIHGFTKVIHGAARGADALADAWARSRGLPVLPFPADWRTHRSAAGPIRNARMLLHGQPDLVVAFPGGAGTADMVNQAVRVGVRVISVDIPKTPPDHS